jgi:hypothetical protein
MPATTNRLALTYPVPADANNVPADLKRIADALDLVVITYAQGTLSTRPAAGTAGRLYTATDSTPNVIYYDTGSVWSILNPNPQALLTAKGDILAASASNTAVKVAIGTDGQALTARSADAGGVGWENTLGLSLSLTGAISATRTVGATVSGPPTTGTFAVGDFNIGQDATTWVCTVAGTPGTWKQAGNNTTNGIGSLVIPGFATPTRSINDTTNTNFINSGETDYPFTVAAPILVKGLGVICTSSGITFRLGLRTSTDAGMPGALLADAGQLVSNTGSIVATIPGGGVTLLPGIIYWATFSQDPTHSAGYYCISSAKTAPIQLPYTSSTPTNYDPTNTVIALANISGSGYPFVANFTATPSPVIYGNNAAPPMQWLVA